jgi:hypothetical protein
MGPTEGKLYVAAFGEHPIATVAVYLQDAFEAGEMGDWPLGLRAHRRRRCPAGRCPPRPVIPRAGPKLAKFGAPRSRDRVPAPWSRRRTAWPNLQRSQRALLDRPQQEGCAAPHPIGQRRTVEFDALAGVDLSLPIQRKMIGIFGDKHETTAPALDPGCGRTKLGQLWACARDDRPWGAPTRPASPTSMRPIARPSGQSPHALPWPWLAIRACTTTFSQAPAAIFGSANHQHAELCQHDVEPLARILADPMQRLATARTGRALPADGPS